MLTEKNPGVAQVSRFSRPGIPQSRQSWDFVEHCYKAPRIFHHKDSVPPSQTSNRPSPPMEMTCNVRAEVCPSLRGRPALPKPSQRSLKTHIRPEKGGLTRFTPLRRPTKPEAGQEIP